MKQGNVIRTKIIEKEEPTQLVTDMDKNLFHHGLLFLPMCTLLINHMNINVIVDSYVKTSMNLDMECQVIADFIWYPLFENEVDVHKGVILSYLEVGVGWMNDFQRLLARA